MTISLRPFLLSSALLLSLGLAGLASADYGDPSERVIRLNHATGDVSYSPAGEDVWIWAQRNRPLVRGDRLWTDIDTHAELQLGSATIRLGENTSFEILDLDDQIAQVQVTQGTLSLRVPHLARGQIYEIATPTLAFAIDRPGRYRIDVAPDYDQATIVVWEGAGEAYGTDRTFLVGAGETVRFFGADLRDYEIYGLPRVDAFDRYDLERNQRLDRSVSLRYVSPDLIGYSDLDDYGTWRPVRDHGTVWFPSQVDPGWAPYRDGHWVWQEPWGWTWVDNAPWGFAPSHYGRWIYVSDNWGWIPGPRDVRPVYAPALVMFVGGSGWSLSLGLGDSTPIGWFPLGPREVYQPSYRVSRDYFTRVNVNNTVINQTTINNTYNYYAGDTINVTQVNYANRTVEGAVTAVPRQVFVNAQPVRQAAIRVDRTALTSGETTRLAPIAPIARSVLGATEVTKSQPPREVLERPVLARHTPPPEPQPFTARERQLQVNPGQPAATRDQAPAAERDDKQPQGRQNVRVIERQSSAEPLRESDSRGANDQRTPGKDKEPSAQPQPLDRSSTPSNRPESRPDDRRRAAEPKDDPGRTEQPSRKPQETDDQPQGQRPQQRPSAVEQQPAAAGRADRPQQAAPRQPEPRPAQADTKPSPVTPQGADRSRQAAPRQQEPRPSQADTKPQSATPQSADRPRQAAPPQPQPQPQPRPSQADTKPPPVTPQGADRPRQATPPQPQSRQADVEEQRRIEQQQQIEARKRQDAEQSRRVLPPGRNRVAEGTETETDTDTAVETDPAARMRTPAEAAAERRRARALE